MILFNGIIFVSLLIYSAIKDIKSREIDNWVCIGIFILSLNNTSFSGGVITAFPYLITSIITNGKIGGGDIKLMFACGTVLGIVGGFYQTVIGLSLVTIFGMYVLIKKGKEKYKSFTLPLAPFLCIGGIISYFIIEF